MATLTVGSGQEYATIESAVAASSSGDTVDVYAGTYTNDFITIGHNLTIQAVNGAVNVNATESPPDGKAILDEGGSGVSVTINGLSFSGAAVSDNNGAGIRYEGGTLSLDNDTFTDNQEGILAATDPNGVITITNSTFNMNGAGDGYSHNIYVDQIASLTVQNSTIENANVGHDIKSRAASTTITGDTITDKQGTASYEIDLPNGGNAVVNNNTIEKGPNASNPIGITYGEEGNLYSTGTLSVTNNLIVNDDSGASTTAVNNATSSTMTVSGNTFYGWTNLTNGPANTSSNTVDTTEPALTPPSTTTSSPPSSGSSNPSSPVTVGSGSDTLALQVSEDAWEGDAQFTVAVDGQQIGGTLTATASHAAGQTQEFDVLGSFGTGSHTATVTFTNDAYGGSSSTDRNLYVNSATLDGTAVSGATLNEYSDGPQSFTFGTATGTTTSAPTVTVGSGPDTLALQVAEDAWEGDAQFTVAVDGQQIGGTLTATTSAAAGQTQTFDVLGTFGAGSHTATVTFLNDAYGGSPSADRNLYVAGATIDGSTVSNSSLAEYSNGPQSFTFQGATSTTTSAPTVTVGSGPDTLALQVAEDAWEGDAQFTVAVDGQQIGGTLTATTSAAAGQTQTFDVLGTFGAGSHTATVTFLNDAYGGSRSTDRNLYVAGATIDGSTVSNSSLAEYSNGPQSFTFIGNSTPVTVGSGAAQIVLQMSEDAWQGDAQFTVAVDGQQIGGTLTATASHAAGQSEQFDIQGAFSAGAHQVAISFINDAYGGSPSTDRNLYVDQVAGVKVGAALYSDGTQTFSAMVPSS